MAKLITCITGRYIFLSLNQQYADYKRKKTKKLLIFLKKNNYISARDKLQNV